MAGYFPSSCSGSIDAATGESLLLPVWNHVRHTRQFVQIALCFATPTLIKLAKEAIADAPDPAALFEHFTIAAGIGIQGREGVARLQLLQALRPYFHLLSDSDLVRLWDTCLEQIWVGLSLASIWSRYCAAENQTSCVVHSIARRSTWPTSTVT